jgi:hypothetical protein
MIEQNREDLTDTLFLLFVYYTIDRGPNMEPNYTAAVASKEETPPPPSGRRVGGRTTPPRSTS